MARIESGKVEIEEKPVNIQEEYDSMITVLSEQARANGLEFHHSLCDVSHKYILADKARMSSITLNITGNAMKYTPAGGRIDFVLQEVKSAKEGYASYMLSVEDTGIGMSEEYQKVLFEPFTREKSSTVNKIQGTGLGMSIVKDLVELMGGKIEVHSELGKGTRFEITIDFKIDEEHQEVRGNEQASETVNLEGRRTLVVEDNPLNREIAIDMLEEQGLQVETAEDGSIAVELLKQNGPEYYDFILMDIQMPVMGGFEATRLIRKMYPDKDIPIIALSANAFEEDRAASVKAGMNEHVAKPISIKSLCEALAKVLK